ncbi:MAG TPA: 3-hydroxyacyl-[acyl-carrier-protein] dehydratase FabZ, partial [Burkholderiaceae bacterium]|nr:3-hydroxyacyl-[acyl-carrier-protein] dehydratase FabZ [Burkholderiaceae bacterium]
MSVLNIHEVLKRLPHRYPLLLVDRVLELEPHQRIRALKNVT